MACSLGATEASYLYGVNRRRSILVLSNMFSFSALSSIKGAWEHAGFNWI